MAEERGLPHRREIFVDDQGVGLRLSWHAGQMLTTVSIWRDDTCVGVFHLEPQDAVRVITFLSANLAEVANNFREGWSASA